MSNRNPNKMMFRADRDTYDTPQKTIDGEKVNLVAIQESTRTKKKRTVYVYHIEGTDTILFNRSRNGVRFMRMALRQSNIRRYYDIFVQEPLTKKEKVWLRLYGYSLQYYERYNNNKV